MTSLFGRGLVRRDRQDALERRARAEIAPPRESLAGGRRAVAHEQDVLCPLRPRPHEAAAGAT